MWHFISSDQYLKSFLDLQSSQLKQLISHIISMRNIVLTARAKVVNDMQGALHLWSMHWITNMELVITGMNSDFTKDFCMDSTIVGRDRKTMAL